MYTYMHLSKHVKHQAAPHCHAFHLVIIYCSKILRCTYMHCSFLVLPLIVKGVVSLSRSLGSGAGSGAG